MPEINAATGALTIPIWAVGAVAAVFLVLMMLAVAQTGMATVMNALFRAAMVIAAVSAAWIYVQYLERQEQAAARRGLDDRAAALLARAVAPGSALSCLNELAGEAVEAACAKAVFASPEAVSAAVNYVTAELALLADGSDHARVDPAYATELAPIRAALELDRFGIVAHVLARRGCKPDRCDALELFNDPARVNDNLREHAFDDLVSKFTTAWNTPQRSTAAAVTAADPAPPPLPALHPVSPQYDFPSADSIPAVNIMVPEPGTANGTAAQGATGASRQATTPIPPKRPQRTPVAAAHPAAPHPSAAAPSAAGEAPTDGAGTSSPSQ
jgi:Na+-transporting methylmalonyl-CoA/oxaloacetate decarboxylase gamma subunit